MPRPDLARVVDLAARLEADSQLDPDALRRRDRTLGRQLEAGLGDATDRVHAWLDRLGDSGGPTVGERAARAQAALHALLFLAGLPAGALAALAVFAYEGTHPVNVVQVLAFFVALQALLLAATVLLALPASWRRRVPGLAALQDLLAVASPGRWLPAFARLLPAEQRQAFERATGLARRHQRLYGDVQKWSWLLGSQLFAVSFHAAALLAALGLVTFSDLAFGWSTTLQLDARVLEGVTGALAAPWSAWLPEAAPDRALIERTQYFRGVGAPVDALASAAWWRFLVLCMLCYGLAPRLLALGFAAWRRRAALRRAFAGLPGVAELHDRLGQRYVSTAGEGAEPGGPQWAPAHRSGLPRPARALAVRWSGAARDDSACAEAVEWALGAELAGCLDGGAGSARADAALVAELAATDAAPVLLVKAWEPPLGELIDLLGELRAALGEGRPVFVLPVGGDEAQARIWARRLDALGDPWLEVLA